MEVQTVSLDNKPISSFDVQRAIKLRLQGLSYQEIGDLLGVTKQAIHYRLHKQFGNDESIEEFRAFKNNKDSYLEWIQHRIAASIDDDDIKTMKNKRGLTDLAILEDKIRLIRGQSTENISVNALQMSLEDLERKRQELLSQLVDNSDNSVDKVSE